MDPMLHSPRQVSPRPALKAIPKNYFGTPTPPLSEMLDLPKVRQYVTRHLPTILNETFAAGSAASTSTANVLRLMRNSNAKSLPQIEREVFDLLGRDLGQIQQDRVNHALKQRAQLICEQISPHCQGSNLLDFGCGNGEPGELTAARVGMQYAGCDVYKHPRVAARQLSFHMIEGIVVPSLSSAMADTTTVITVLHHSDDPVGAFREALRLTRPGGRVLVIESVNGVRPIDLTQIDSGLRNPTPQEMALARLTPREGHYVGAFFDWFYNRILFYSDDLQQKVPVPFNFQGREKWSRFFESFGTREISQVVLGIDLPQIVPEFHVLYVLERGPQFKST